MCSTAHIHSTRHRKMVHEFPQAIELANRATSTATDGKTSENLISVSNVHFSQFPTGRLSTTYRRSQAESVITSPYRSIRNTSPANFGQSPKDRTTSFQSESSYWEEDLKRGRMSKNVSTLITKIFKPRQLDTTNLGEQLHGSERGISSSEIQTAVRSESKSTRTGFHLSSRIDYLSKLRLQSVRHMYHGILRRYTGKFTASRTSNSYQPPKSDLSEESYPLPYSGWEFSSVSSATLCSTNGIEVEPPSRVSALKLDMENSGVSYKSCTNTAFLSTSRGSGRPNVQLNKGSVGLEGVEPRKQRPDCILTRSSSDESVQTLVNPGMYTMITDRMIVQSLTSFSGRSRNNIQSLDQIEENVKFYQADLEREYEALKDVEDCISEGVAHR
jgi:hypothetical protein